MEKIYSCKYKTPDGLDDIIMTSDGEFLTGLYFDNSSDMKKLSENIPAFDEVCRWLDMYFSGREPGFVPKYKIEGFTPFRRRVTEIMCEIPYGGTVSYGDIADRIAAENGIEKMSAQAVGGAVGANPICIIVPCHRVIGKTGNLVGYGGGISNKIKLLELEGHDTSHFKMPKKYL